MSTFPSISELLTHTAVRVALAIVGCVLVGSLAYYLIATAPPKVSFVTAKNGNIVEDVTGTGIVSPVQNPILSFETGGQVTQVRAVAGQKVAAGTLLATLDTGVLSASLSAAQAKLNELEAGPRSVDLAAQQTAVLSAQQTLSNTYANYPQTLLSALSSAQSAVNSDVDSDFSFSSPSAPALITRGANLSDNYRVDAERASLILEFKNWSTELASANGTLSPAQLQAFTTQSIGHLKVIRTFLVDLLGVLNNQQVSGGLSAQQTANIASANAALAIVNGLITSLTNAGESITTNQLALQSAQDQLNQATAGATSQDIQAQQAQVAGIEAQLKQQEIVAPFSGTIASVSIKPGDAVSANTAAIALIPTGTFEVDVYLAENDVTKVIAGDKADVTLDAYGTNRTFPATVGTVETSPSINPNSPGGTSGGYKVTLVFDSADPAITNGMHASATIHAGNAQNVLLIPASSVIIDGPTQYVLKQTAKGLVKTPVTIGLTNSTMAQVLSGITAGDTVSSVGAQN